MPTCLYKWLTAWLSHHFLPFLYVINLCIITICYLINLYIIIIYYYYVLLSFANTLSQQSVPASNAMTVTPSHTPTLGHLPLGACQPANRSVKPVKCCNFFGGSLASSWSTSNQGTKVVFALQSRQPNPWSHHVHYC